MSEGIAVSKENNHDYKLLGNFTADEDRCDSRELPARLKTIAKNCEEVAEKLKRRNSAKYEKGQGSTSKQQTAAQTSNARIAEFQKTADLLMSENDKLAKEIERKPEDSSSQKGVEREADGQSVSSLKAENIKLRQVCKEITGINKKWQKYNKEVQLYIERLEDAVRNMEKEENASETLSTSQRRRDVNSELSERESSYFIRYDNPLNDTCQLQKELEISKQTENVLREQLELLSMESQETIKLLHCQLAFYKEDYEAERREKLLARTKMMELSNEHDHVRSQLKGCQKRLRQVEDVSRSPGVKSTAASTNPFAFNLIERETINSRRNSQLTADGSFEVFEVPVSPKSVDDGKKSKDAVAKHDSLECPDCGTTFPSEKRKEYLEHFENCQRN